MEVVAEQIAWFKGKSRRIGLKLPLTDDIWALLRKNMVYGFNLGNAGWEPWSNGKSKLLAELLDYNKAPESLHRRSARILHALRPLTGCEALWIC